MVQPDVIVVPSTSVGPRGVVGPPLLAVEIRSPHLGVAALRELAARYNAFYNGHHFLVDDAAQRCARLALAACVRRVLANGLGILGVSAPETM